MNLLKELEELRRPHWNDCDKPYVDTMPCTCGADEHNKKLDEIIEFVKQLFPDRYLMIGCAVCTCDKPGHTDTCPARHYIPPILFGTDGI